MKFITFIVGFVLLVPFFIYIQRNSLKVKLRKINKTRSRFTKDDFVIYFEARGYDPEIAEIAYDEIMEWIVLKNFTLMPDDNLHLLCDFRDFDDMDFIHEVCSGLGYKMPDQHVLDELNEKYNEFTPEYLIDLLQNHASKHPLQPHAVVR